MTRGLQRLTAGALALLCVAVGALGCGEAPKPAKAKAETPEAAAELKARQERILALENDLQRQQLALAQLQQKLQDQILEAEKANQQAAADLIELKKASGMDASAPALALPEVSDEAAPAPAKPAAEPPADRGGPGFFARLLYVIVLLVAAFLFFKYLNRWQERASEDEDDADDERMETGLGTITLTPTARRQGGELNSDAYPTGAAAGEEDDEPESQDEPPAQSEDEDDEPRP